MSSNAIYSVNTPNTGSESKMIVLHLAIFYKNAPVVLAYKDGVKRLIYVRKPFDRKKKAA